MAPDDRGGDVILDAIVPAVPAVHFGARGVECTLENLAVHGHAGGAKGMHGEYG